ncbi:MAG: hypothetical protein DHS20C17_16720 [Cyclobacteriaceae bacterium]|nr:MAG: hypothetical protein DHS20C17_16720 [Cyclobacteriaceae bacterium]
MNIGIIGGTGKTGAHIINQALEKGHKVTAIVRKPGKIKKEHPNLTVVQGNVLELDSLIMAFQNQDAVISSLGHKRFFIKTSILSRGTANIIEAMKRSGVSRFICITALGIGDSRFKLGLYYTLFVIPFILFFYFRDKEKQEKLIQNSDLDWTIVRPGQLISGKKKGIYKHGEGLGSYILTKLISRADVAHFVLQELETNQYLRRTPAIIY